MTHDIQELLQDLRATVSQRVDLSGQTVEVVDTHTAVKIITDILERLANG